ncbi:MAG: hypothetical protein ACOX8U_09915 [Bradymonadia bacterium]|jgi:hypothetical protein
MQFYRFNLIVIVLSLILFASLAFAQESDLAGGTVSVDEAIVKASPPERAALGKRIFASKKDTEALDALIASLEQDDARIPAIHSTLSSTPMTFKGPRLMKLAEFSSQKSGWRAFLKNDLRAYPDAYAEVLRIWLKDTSPNAPEFYPLLDELFVHSAKDAARLWLWHAVSFSREEFLRHKRFAEQEERILGELLKQLGATRETERGTEGVGEKSLRLLSILVNNVHALKYAPEQSALLGAYVDVLCDSKAVSERILGMRLLALAKLSDRVGLLKSLFKDGSNVVERAFALESLASLDLDAACKAAWSVLGHKDPTLRLAAVQSLEKCPLNDEASRKSLETAFSVEYWPEISVTLYELLRQVQPDLFRFDRSVAKNTNIDMELREIAMLKSIESRQQPPSMKDVAEAESWGMSLGTCAKIVEAVYNARPDVRSSVFVWILQHDHRDNEIMGLFAATLRVAELDAIANFPAYFTRMCELYEHVVPVLGQCVHWLESRRDNPAYDALYQKLSRTKARYDAHWLDDL